MGDLVITAELCQMALHVSLEDLQNFAGKSGEEEASHAAAHLEDSWATSSEARYAVWHAGQVFNHARRMPPASLRDFNAVAVYFASLTLWVYGLLSSNSPQESASADIGRKSQSQPNHSPRGLVLLDGEENRDTKAFIQLGRGIPGLAAKGGAKAGVEPLRTQAQLSLWPRTYCEKTFLLVVSLFHHLSRASASCYASWVAGITGRGNHHELEVRIQNDARGIAPSINLV